MIIQRPQSRYPGRIVAFMAAALCCAFAENATAQQTNTPIKVDRSMNRIEMISKTSRLLHFDYAVPELFVDNQAIVRATPVSADKILLTGLKPGFATLTVSSADKQLQTIDVLVGGDVRALESTLKQLYPNSNIRAIALETGVVLNGTLARAADAQNVMNIASEYFPQAHNHLKFPDSQLIAIEVQVYEVARSKVRELGIDWQIATDEITLNVAGANNPTNNIAFSVVNNGNSLNMFLQALESQNLAKLLDKPTLVSQNGRPAEFLQGGELPFLVANGLGTSTIEFRPFGTKLDIVPIVQGEGVVRLEVRAEVSEPSADLANASGVSGFRVRRVNTGVDMKVGHTLALAGDIREEVETRSSGIPGLKNTPYIGAFFRRVQEERREIETVILLTPRYIGEVDPALLPVHYPGSQSTPPSDCELYQNGHIEVPRCGPDCGGLSNYGPTFLNYYGNANGNGPHEGPQFVPNMPAPGQVPVTQPQSAPAPPIVAPGDVSGFGFPKGNSMSPAPRTGTNWYKLNPVRR